MISQKSCIENPHGGGWLNRELKFLGLFLALISFSNLFFSNNTFALFTPTLSASIDNSAITVNGKYTINSMHGWATPSVGFTINTDNRTGYSVYLNTETDDTDLINVNSTTNARIKSIKEASTYPGFPQNSWGYGVKIYDYTPTRPCYPIPGKSTSSKIYSIDKRDMNDGGFRLFTCMMLSDTLESGTYTNKLMISIVSNPYEKKAKMTYGSDFNTKLHSLETTTNKIEHLTRSYNLPSSSVNTINVESYDSDYEIKIWFDTSNNTAYYYTDSEKIILNSNCQGMFMRFDKMKELDLRDFDSSLVENMHTMFYEMRTLESIDLSNFDTRNVRTMYAMFNADVSLENLDVSNFRTDNVSDMKYMFFEMRKLKELNLSNFNTSNVVDMSVMFSNMYALTTLDLSSFNTSKVTDMSYMFYNMNKIIDLDLSNFNTQNVTDMGGMFAYVTNLKSLNLANFNTKKVTNMYSMFSSMPSLITLDLSSFDTSNVTNMDGMFYHANSLTSLVLSNFDTSNVVNMQSMFELGDEDTDKDKLTVIYVNNDFNTAKLANFSEMFKNRKKLRGGNGSYLANPSIADKSWLRIDDPTHGRPGYFTRKP